MNTTTPLAEKTLGQLLGLEALPERERESFLANIGELIMEGVMLRVIAGMNEEEVAAFDSFVATDPTPEAMYEYLNSKVPEIEQLFEEESQAFREECIDLLSRTSGTNVAS